MLQRVWRCTVDVDRAHEYEQFAQDISLPMFRSQPGFRGCLMARQGGECQVLTLWDSQESIDALSDSASYNATVANIRAAGFITQELGTSVTPVHLAALSRRMNEAT